MTTASSSSHATSSRLHKYGSYAEDDRGRIRAYDDPNLCIYIRSKTDSQTSRLAECDKTQKSDENKHNTAWDYNGSAKLYDEISVSSIYNNDEACTASDDGTEIDGTQCSDLCLTYVGNSLEPDDWVKTQNLYSKACDRTDDEFWAFGTCTNSYTYQIGVCLQSIICASW